MRAARTRHHHSRPDNVSLNQSHPHDTLARPVAAMLSREGAATRRGRLEGRARGALLGGLVCVDFSVNGCFCQFVSFSCQFPLY